MVKMFPDNPLTGKLKILESSGILYFFLWLNPSTPEFDGKPQVLWFPGNVHQRRRHRRPVLEICTQHFGGRGSLLGRRQLGQAVGWAEGGPKQSRPGQIP